MDIDEYIEEAIHSSLNMKQADDIQSMIWTISELEAACDMDGINSFMDRYGSDGLKMAIRAYGFIGATDLSKALKNLSLNTKDESNLKQCNNYVTSRMGYDYDMIYNAVQNVSVHENRTG